MGNSEVVEPCSISDDGKETLSTAISGQVTTARILAHLIKSRQVVLNWDE